MGAGEFDTAAGLCGEVGLGQSFWRILRGPQECGHLRMRGRGVFTDRFYHLSVKVVIDKNLIYVYNDGRLATTYSDGLR